MSGPVLIAPPKEHQFKPGHSGNPKGRPAGSPNVATAIKKALSRTVTVRRGEELMEVSAARAMLGGVVDRALKGDFRAFKQVFDLLKDTGHDQDVSDEERAAKELKLPNPFTRDQYDLSISEARKREYCSYAVLADYRLGFKVIEVPAAGDSFFVLLRAADHERMKGRLSEAFSAYCKMLEGLESSGAKGQVNEAMRNDRLNRVLVRIALVASDFIFARKPALALRAASLADRPETCANWLAVVRAHANLMLGNIDAARQYYYSHATSWREAVTSWERVVMLDFRALRKAGFDHQLMSEVEKRYTDAGWSVDRFGAEVPSEVTAARFDGSPPASLRTRQEAAPQAAAEAHLADIPSPSGSEALDSATNASDIASGDKLFAAGRFADACTVYKRRVAECKRRLDAGQRMPGIIDERTAAFLRIRNVAMAFLTVESITEARSAADYLLQTEGKNVLNRILQAHVDMFEGRDSHARGIYYEVEQMRADEDRNGRRVILDDFQTLEARGIVRPLMAELKDMLSRRRLIR
jgi:hypothetical protein